MRELEGSVSDAPVLACPYCGSNEPLPADAQERVAFIRRLGTGRAWADDPLRGRLVYMLGQYEGPWLGTTLSSLGLVAMGLAAGWIFGRGDALALLRTDIAGLSPAALSDLRWSTAFHLALAPVAIASTALYAITAVVRARTILRREIGPWVMASASGIAGESERCRRCGAELPHIATALRDCTYCKAANVVSADGVVRAYVAAARASAAMHPQDAQRKLADVETQLRTEIGRAGWIATIGGVLTTIGLTCVLANLR